MKRCSKCQAENPKTEFGKHRIQSDGLNSICKACGREGYCAWYAANTERARERARSWCAANPERRAETKRKRDSREGCGVYGITCTETGEIYIGSTTRGFAGRFEQHRNKLSSVSHPNKWLQELHDTYGAESLVYRKLAILEPFMCRRTERALIERTPNCINVIGATARVRR